MTRTLFILICLAGLALLVGCAEKLPVAVGPDQPTELRVALLAPDSVRVGDPYFCVAQMTGGLAPYSTAFLQDDSLVSQLPYYQGRQFDTGLVNLSLQVTSADGQLANAQTKITVYPLDTSYVIIDSSHVDTVVVRDTLWLPDTVFVGNLCDKIESSRQVINWMLINSAGRYLLEFEANTERNQPQQTLLVTISNQVYTWELSDLSLTLELDLPAHTMISIVADTPPARGHGIDVCLAVTRL